ncbi:hypothetical protein FHG87_023553 [Trinorchestia longiramus]|nr:hypothetical protein FHG87_023553 [Trinorchestia longiramus]
MRNSLGTTIILRRIYLSQRLQSAHTVLGYTHSTLYRQYKTCHCVKAPQPSMVCVPDRSQGLLKEASHLRHRQASAYMVSACWGRLVSGRGDSPSSAAPPSDHESKGIPDGGDEHLKGTPVGGDEHLKGTPDGGDEHLKVLKVAPDEDDDHLEHHRGKASTEQYREREELVQLKEIDLENNLQPEQRQPKQKAENKKSGISSEGGVGKDKEGRESKHKEDSEKDVEGIEKDKEGSEKDKEDSEVDAEGSDEDAEGSDEDAEGSDGDAEGSDEDAEGSDMEDSLKTPDRWPEVSSSVALSRLVESTVVPHCGV